MQVKERPKIQTNLVYDILTDSKKDITVLQGGTGSGKTMNTLIWFINKLFLEENKLLTIVRETMPAHEKGALRDFIKILNLIGLYSEKDHNKSDNTYRLNTSTVEFISASDPQRIRGGRRDYLFLNEANELDFETWNQLVLRTNGKVVLDYNPSMEYHWIYEDVLTRDDVDFYITTYKDNPFLPAKVVKEIERLAKVDEERWKVYGQGQRGGSSETIYNNWKFIPIQEYKEIEGGIRIYGQDFGYNCPSALVEVVIKDQNVYVNELMYETKLTTSDLIERYKNFNISKRDEIYADSAEPKTVEEMYRAGYNIFSSNKSVWDGIMKVKSMPLFITSSSVNLIKEIKNYKWKKDRDGKVLEDPIKFMDHALDAMRYAVYTYMSMPRQRYGLIDLDIY